jgi:dsRNA-specific ribonuclease
LERFEFLGDAILDYIIVTAMYGQEIELSHIQMHHLRTSLVNADIIAFMCIEWSIEQEIVDLELDTSTTDQDESAKFTEKVIKVSLPLWRFLRHMSPTLGAVQLATSIRHAELRGLILEAFESGTHYPWALLARLQAQKFFSDMVESLIGAVWIDSGSFETCTEIVERIGILPYLRRILKDGVHILHPKEELGMLADTESVRYVIASKNGDVNEGRVFLCTVFVGDVEVVEVGGGVSQEEVKTKAAEMAVEILKTRKGGAEGGQMNVEETVQGETIVDVVMKDEN